MLYRNSLAHLDETLALAATAALLFLIANVFPFIALKIEARIEESLVISGVLAMFEAGQPGLAVLVALTSVVFPAVTIFGMLWVLVPLKLGRRAPAAVAVFRVIRALGPWTLLGVFMLGVMVAFVKLGDLATVIPGVSMFAFGALMVTAAAANARFDASLLWSPQGPEQALPEAGATAFDLGLTACGTCALLSPAGPSPAHCERCATRLPSLRKPDSIGRTWALLIAASVLAVPANIYPVMTVVRFGQGEPSTIIEGVMTLLHESQLALAFIVFFASIVVPLIKIGLLVYLLLSVQSRSRWRPRDRLRLFRITEVVGAWSMVDIFLVAILSALVQLEALATIEPGIGASFFGAVVVLTMFAARAFDSRLIWDHAVSRA